jgi:hypothetical protein
MVGDMTFEQRKVAVDGIRKTETLDQQQRGAQASEAATANLVGDVVADVPVGEQAAPLLLPAPLAETTLDPPLAIPQPLLYCGVHLKSLAHFRAKTSFPLVIVSEVPMDYKVRATGLPQSRGGLACFGSSKA